MNEIHGLRVKRLSAVGAVDQQKILVEDWNGMVTLSLSSSSFPAAMTIEEAREIARQLIACAERLEKVEP